MKLIIDIPEETYQIIRDTQHLGDSGEATLENVLIRAVEKGEKQRTGHWLHEYKDQSNHIMRTNEIKQIIDECEFIQLSNESEYTKEQSKISAYDHIKELMEDNNNDR